MFTPQLEFLEQLVTWWAQDRLIIPRSTPLAQARKTLEEAGELLEASAVGDVAAMEDAIGDIAVTLINGLALADKKSLFQLYGECKLDPSPVSAREVHRLCGELLLASAVGAVSYTATAGLVVNSLLSFCESRALDFTQCLQGAYEEIKDRKGTLGVDGIFYKETK